jgi:plastocyanin
VTQSVNIDGFTFGPGTLSVKKGQSINWTNGDDSPHQVSVASESLKAGVLLKGQSGQLKFSGQLRVRLCFASGHEGQDRSQRTETRPFGPGLRPARDYSELYNGLYNNLLK